MTGGNGFLGQSVLAYFLKHSKDDIYTLGRSEFDYSFHRRCDILDLKRLKEVIEEVQPSTVIHCSANPSVKLEDGYPSQIIRDNIEGTNNLLSCLKNRPRFVFTSSATIYGHYDKEKPPTWITRCSPISIYATTKLACENLIRVYEAQGKVYGTSVRIPGIVGCNATHGVLRDLIRKVESDSEFLELIGTDPGTIKPFCHVDEVAKIIYRIAIDEVKCGHTCVIGPKHSISVKDMSQIVMEKLDIKKERKWSGSIWSGDNPEIYLSPCITTFSDSDESIRLVLKEYKELKNGKINRV